MTYTTAIRLARERVTHNGREIIIREPGKPAFAQPPADFGTPRTVLANARRLYALRLLERDCD